MKGIKAMIKLVCEKHGTTVELPNAEFEDTRLSIAKNISDEVKEYVQNWIQFDFVNSDNESKKKMYEKHVTDGERLRKEFDVSAQVMDFLLTDGTYVMTHKPCKELLKFLPEDIPANFSDLIRECVRFKSNLILTEE